MSKEWSVFSNDQHKFTLEWHVLIYSSSFIGGVLLKKMCLKMAQIWQEDTFVGILFIKVAGFADSATLLKKYSNTGVFLWNLFVEHLQTAASGPCKHSIWACYSERWNLLKVSVENSLSIF